jgi:anti-sigma factor RsiW
VICRSVRSKISRYLDGELPLVERKLLETHLVQCDDCAAELAELRGLDCLLREAATPPPPPWLAQSISQRARNEGTGGTSSWVWLKTLKAWPFAMKFATTSTALLGVYVGLLISGAGSPRVPAVELAWVRSASHGAVVAAYQGVSR